MANAVFFASSGHRLDEAAHADFVFQLLNHFLLNVHPDTRGPRASLNPLIVADGARSPTDELVSRVIFHRKHVPALIYI